MSRITSKQVGIRSMNEFNRVVDEIGTLKDRRKAVKTQLDQDIDQLTEQSGLHDLDMDIAAKLALAESYAKRNEGILFPGKARTASTGISKYGFKKGRRALVLLNNRFSWSGVIRKLKTVARGKYLKTVEPEIRKDILKNNMTDAQLAKLGMRTEQTESFWVEPVNEPATKTQK